jgi:hypothetical protein
LALAACVSFQAVSPENMKAYEVSLAVAGDELAMAWYGGPDELDAIYLQWLDGQGRARGAPVQLTDGERHAYEPDLQLLAGDPLLAWYEKDRETGDLTAWLARTDRAGNILWKHALSAGGGNARNPVVRVGGNAINVAWIETARGDGPQVWSERFTPDGTPQFGPSRAGDASAETWNLNAALGADGMFYVVYNAKLEAKASELHLLAIGNDAVSAIPLSGDDGHPSVYPDIGINDRGQAAITWFDDRDGNNEIYLSVLPLQSLTSRAPTAGLRVTHTRADSIGAYLAWNGPTLAVVWCDASEGQYELYAQEFDMAGAERSEVKRLTRSQDQTSIPAIRPYKRGFLVAWNDYDSVGPHGTVFRSNAATTRFGAQ